MLPATFAPDDGGERSDLGVVADERSVPQHYVVTDSSPYPDDDARRHDGAVADG